MEFDSHIVVKVRREILLWHSRNPREMPWKKTSDPYKIWVSEIILQQTRVVQGIKYYSKFINQFPTIYKLAEAPIEKVLKAWQGLGYYSRAKNLHETARYLVENNDGQFPREYKNIYSLKGIGPYTASAIVSFAFNKKKAVVDGNVIRVLSRIFGIEESIHLTETKKKINSIANHCICPENPGKYNQAIMNFGALHCKPAKPDCVLCKLNTVCVAYNAKKTHTIPLRKKAVKKTTRYFQFLVIDNNNHIILDQRKNHDIWPLLHQFPLFESKHFSKNSLDQKIGNIFQKPMDFQVLNSSKEYKQKLSHQIVHAVFHEISITRELKRSNILPGFLLEEIKNLDNFAFPKIIDCYLNDKLIYLEDQSKNYAQ